MKWFGKQLGDMNLVAVLAGSAITWYFVSKRIRKEFDAFYKDLTSDEQEIEIKGFETDGLQ